MDYKWEIHSLLKNQNSSEFVKKAIQSILNHLLIRDYENISKSVDVKIFQFVDKATRKRYSIDLDMIKGNLRITIIGLNLNQNGFDQKISKPNIVLALEDFCKTKGGDLFYVETLNNEEIILLEKYKRSISPYQIYEYLKVNNFDKETKIPTKVYQDEGQEHEYIVVLGNKNDYRNIIEFWISFRCWYSPLDHLNFEDLNVYTESNYISEELGRCIPIGAGDSLNISPWILNLFISRNMVENNEELKVCYEMKKNFEDIILLFDYNEKYLVLYLTSGVGVSCHI